MRMRGALSLPLHLALDVQLSKWDVSLPLVLLRVVAATKLFAENAPNGDADDENHEHGEDYENPKPVKFIFVARRCVGQRHACRFRPVALFAGGTFTWVDTLAGWVIPLGGANFLQAFTVLQPHTALALGTAWRFLLAEVSLPLRSAFLSGPKCKCTQFREAFPIENLRWVRQWKDWWFGWRQTVALNCHHRYSKQGWLILQRHFKASNVGRIVLINRQWALALVAFQMCWFSKTSLEKRCAKQHS